MDYVCGFAFAGMETLSTLLIRKNRPAWQLGQWNGVGGKIELGEGIRSAMVREFKEETGISTDATQWSTFHIERFQSGAKVYFMSNWTTEYEQMKEAKYRSMYGGLTDEVLNIYPVDPYTGELQVGTTFPALYNLRYLIPMAVQTHALPYEHRPLG